MEDSHGDRICDIKRENLICKYTHLVCNIQNPSRTKEWNSATN